jgi:hypothetical protein
MAEIKIRVSPQTLNGLKQDALAANLEVAIAERDMAAAKTGCDAAWSEASALRGKVKELTDAVRGAESYASVVCISALSLMAMREVVSYAEADLEVAEEAFNAASALASKADVRLCGALAFARATDLFLASVETHTVETSTSSLVDVHEVW